MIESLRSISIAKAVSSRQYVALKSVIVIVVLIAIDGIAVLASLQTAWMIRAGFLPRYFTGLSPLYIDIDSIKLVVPIICLAFMWAEGMYKDYLPFWKSAQKLVKVTMLVTVLTITILYFISNTYHVSRLFLALMWLSSVVYLLLLRYIAIRSMVAAGLSQKPVIIIGAGKTAELLVQGIAQDTSRGYKVVGFIDDEERPLTRVYPRIGSFATAEAAIMATQVKDVILATPGLKRLDLLELINRIQPLVTNLVIVPDLFEVPVGDIRLETLFHEKVLLLKLCNNLDSLMNRQIKRAFDLMAGVLILSLVLPLLLIIAMIIKLDSPGPVCYVGSRLGKNGRYFRCYKFRTMRCDSDAVLEQYLQEQAEARQEWKKFAKLRSYDPRLTKFGALLRKYSLDELPQLLNVIKGDMSLVGPRPYLPRERGQMGYFVNTIFRVTPGMTGLWQVSGRNSVDFDGRVVLDVWYVRNWTLWLDIVLLCKTIKVVLTGRDAY